MSQIVKTDNGFGVEVPVCAGICDHPSSSEEILLNGQIVVGTSTRPATNDQKPIYVGDGNTKLKNLDPINKVLPLNGKNIKIGRPGSKDTDVSYVGGFTVGSNDLDGGKNYDGTTKETKATIKNFTADTVKVILESGSYGESIPESSAEQGQVFFLYGQNSVNSLQQDSEE